MERYLWYVDGNLKDSSSSYNTSFIDSGLYRITLGIETYYHCLDSFHQNIFIYPSPSISLSHNLQCEQRDIDFRFTEGLYISKKFNWDFGDGSISTQKSTSYQYNGIGTFSPKLHLEFTDSSQCVFNLDSITIKPSPISDFYIFGDTNQCFKDNNVCIVIMGNESDIAKRTIVWGDGISENNFTFNDSVLCHHYSDTFGGLYTINLEVVDSFGCFSSTKKDSVVLIYRDFQIDFLPPDTIGCFSTEIQLFFTTNKTLSEVDSLRWDFGDGGTNFDDFNPIYTYNSDSTFDISLWAKDSFGCKDSVVKTRAVTNVFFEIDAKIDSSLSSFCRNSNQIYFSQTPYPNASVQWEWDEVVDTISLGWTPIKRYRNPGKFVPEITVTFGKCEIKKSLDTVIVRGPRALLSRIDNRYQCQITDTVYFTNGSIFEGNESRLAFWDFADPIAPACTTNYSKGINIDSNCRYSTDSLFTKHWYTPGTERCFVPQLIAYDTVSGCADTIRYGIPLMAPKADKDLTFSNPRNGLIINRDETRIGRNDDYAFVVNLSQTQPSCGRQRWYIMWDSLRAAESGNFDSHWQRGRYQYTDTQYYNFSNKPADKDGFVTIGLVIQNGLDTNDNVCRDTAWYHHFLKFEMYDPEFISDYDSTQHYCQNTSFTFRIKDTSQQHLDSVIWSWGDGTFDFTTDSFFRPINKKYDSGGNFVVRLTAITKNGCRSSWQQFIKVGYRANYNVALNAPFLNVCKGDQVPIFFNVNYPLDINLFWADSNRALIGKESLRFDFDDGLGFRTISYPISYQFNISGIHQVFIEIKDSFGCMDTFQTPNYNVKYLESSISLNQDTFVCAQNISFTSKITQFDSSSSKFQDTTGLISYRWNFGFSQNENIFANPTTFLREGNYQVRLIVENDIGCKDTVYKPFVVTGPIAYFSILGDSIGCQPYSIAFKNESIGASSYIWRFNDGSGSSLNTSSDTVFDFLYRNYGKFSPFLIARGNYVRNGIPITCTNTFPDTITPGFREIEILETPIPRFNYSTNCFTRTTRFFNRSLVDSTTISSVFWDYGDGNSSSEFNPTHQYTDTGRYIVKLICFSANGCVVS